jgi:putative N6-adenine-specific DNA methylase
MADFFAACPRGLEAPLAEELAALGVPDSIAHDGGVAFSCGWREAYAVNLWSRVASRVLWRVAKGSYQSEQDLYDFALRQPWNDWFSADRSLRVNVVATRSPLKSIEFATLRIKDAICDHFRARVGKRPSIDKKNAEVRVHAYLAAGECVLYCDTTGDALFKRGYRKSVEEAPLRENLAAGILRLAGWHPGLPLLDPMCGSGTFLVEAAMQALDIAPGGGREFAFRHLSWFDAAIWQELSQEAEARQQAPEFAQIWGSDIAASAIAAAQANLAAAGVARAVRIKCSDILELEAPAAEGVLLCNPPYGVRMASESLPESFYPKLGDVLKQRFAGWTACLLSADLALPRLIGLKPRRKIPLFNGALECRLFVYPLVAGSMRRPRPDAPESDAKPN